MSDAISWVIVMNVKEGKEDDYRALCEEMVAATRDEEGALVYEWFAPADGSQVHIYERYADNDATMAHLATFGSRFAERFFGFADPAGMWVYGEVSDAVRAALAPGGAEFYGSYGGFAR